MFLRSRKIGSKEYFSIEERVWDSVKRSPKGRTVVTLGTPEQAHKRLAQAFKTGTVDQEHYDRFLSMLPKDLSEATELPEKFRSLEDDLIRLREENKELKQETTRLKIERDYFEKRYEMAASETDQFLRELAFQKSERQHYKAILENIEKLTQAVVDQRSWCIVVPPGEPPRLHRGTLGEVHLTMPKTEVIPIPLKDQQRFFFKLAQKALKGENIFGDPMSHSGDKK